MSISTVKARHLIAAVGRLTLETIREVQINSIVHLVALVITGLLLLFWQVVLSRNHKMLRKPVVLHLGDAVKYNHEFYEQEFLGRFEVVRSGAETREEFIDALRQHRFVLPSPSRGLTCVTDIM